MPRQIDKIMIALYFILCLLVGCKTTGYFEASKTDDINKSCFCELQGSINDCSCNVDTVDHFNNIKIYPRLRSLLVKDFFRFYKTNLMQECPFWVDNSKCAMQSCSVQSCEEGDLPEGLKEYDDDEKPYYKYTSEGNENDCDDLTPRLSYLNTSISQKAHEGFQKWADHDEAEDDFCILDDQHNGAEYVDLLLNPERYTGYKGESAHRVWRSIYLENCFAVNGDNKNPSYILHLDMANVCLEQRAFYRFISGLHSSINIHLCSKYFQSESKNFLEKSEGVWGQNLEEFQRRFSPEITDGQGPHWLKNLYFIYLVELRALSKAAPYLRSEEYFTGFIEEDHEVKLAINDLLSVIESFSSHFNETKMFSSGIASIKLKNDFKEKFRNISRIMDCVGCDKCRLWGKLQTQGLGTALKILFSEKFTLAAENGLWSKYSEHSPGFRLTRTEIVSLFNAFGRLSNSIFELENFRKLLR